MKYIPEFYTDTDFPEYEKLPKDYQKEVEKDCEAYKEHIVKAIEEARKLYIEKHLHKNVLYSRTWGKS